MGEALVGVQVGQRGEQGDEAPGDAELIAAVRRGEVAAYGVLYERHLVAARRAAGLGTATAAEREDLVAEGFARVLRVLRAGGGPEEGFRPYLLTTIRNTLIDWRRRDTAVSLVPEIPDVHPTTGCDEVVSDRVHASLAAGAFATLPERWRNVLWRTEVEGESPAQVAAALGMTPNGVSALAYRAREGLRQAYLDQYVPRETQPGCGSVVVELAGWVRGRFSHRKMCKIADHLRVCADCREVADGLRQLNHELPAIGTP